MFRWVWTSSLVIASSVVGIGYLWISHRKREDEIPVNWIQAGFVENLLFYPLKAGKPVELKEAECTELGFREVVPGSKYSLRDRGFVIYQSADHDVLHVLKWKKAPLISLKLLENDVILLQAPDCEDFRLQLSDIIENPKREKIYLFGGDLETIDCGDKVAKWVSRFLSGSDETHRLGCYVENLVQRPDNRLHTPNYKKISSAYKHWRGTDGGLYSDLTSYLILNSLSVDDVNSKLPPEDHFTYYNMRPNIVVKGEKPYAEDEWKWMKIGDDVILRTIKHCTRCMRITVNPLNTERNPNMQPFKILKQYRSLKQVAGMDIERDMPVFGLNGGLYNSGRIKIGDPVYVSV